MSYYSASGARRLPPPQTDRVAGDLVAATPGMFGWLSDLVGGRNKQANDAVRGVTQGAKNLPGRANTATANLLKAHGGKMLSGGTVLSLLAAANELNDPNDPMLRNAAEGAGMFAGNWAGFAGGAALGAPMGPLGSLALGTVGALGGGQALKNVAGGVYDLVAGESPQERGRRNALRDAETRAAVSALEYQARAPYIKDAMAMNREDAFLRAERDLQIANDYNFANALNQQMLMRQQASTLQDLAMTQYLMS